MKTAFSKPEYLLAAGDFAVTFKEKTKIMGIINATPDSFSGDGILKEKNFIAKAVQLALKQIDHGADFIDVGGESSRPQAKKISAAEEIKRVVPVITKLAKTVKVPVSIDTYKGQTAFHALDAGASIVNNIRGIRAEKKLLKMAARYKAAIVIMHMRGTPQTMQRKTLYKNLVEDIISELRIALENCLEIGIKSDNIILDPGIGFAKTAEQNLEILQRLREFKVFHRPVLIGTSRKSFIGQILNQLPGDRLLGTVASNVVAITNGANILRVHDVYAMSQAALVTDAILNKKLF